MQVSRLKVLNEGDLEKLDSATMRILSEVGVRYNSEKVLDILSKAGAEVDEASKIARLPEKMVRGALALVPSQIKLYNRDLEEHIILGDGKTKVASGHNAIYVLDEAGGERREATCDDIGRFVALADALDEIDVVGIQAMPQDVKPESTILHAYFESARNSRKHVFFSPDEAEVVRSVIEMARVVCGRDDLSEGSPVTCQLSPSSPLTWTSGSIEGVVECAVAGIPVCILPEPFSGATCPVTIAGQLAQHNAEALSGVVVAQLVREGTPVIWACASTTFDMKKGNVLICSPEAAVLRVATAQLAHYYGMPCHCIGPDTDAHDYDEQTGWEKMLTTISAMSAGIDLFVNCGMFSTGLTVSLAQLVADSEVVSICRRFLQGMQVDEETLAVDVVAGVGPGGNFMETEHTLEHLRKGALWEEQISNRRIYDTWKKEGGVDVMANAGEKAASILSAHQSKAPAESIQAEMKKLIKEFESRCRSA